jgi:vancomycin resistance protein VanJ
MRDTDGVRISVMTYNVGNGLAHPHRLADFVKLAAADVVGIQELAVPQADALSRLSSMYPYQVFFPAGFAGKGLLSRYPIVAHEPVALYPDRPDLRATIEVGGAGLNVLVAHPPPPRLRGARLAFDSRAVSQIESLAALALERAPGVLLGDFNMTPRNPAYARFIASGLVDAFGAVGGGAGLTLPLRVGHAARFRHRLHRFPLRPVARVDYIWCTPGVLAEAAWVGNDAGSDHLPVLARLVVQSG